MVTAAMTPELATAKRLCAIAAAVKPKQLTEAKASLPDGSGHDIDIAVRIRGRLTKGIAEPGTSGDSPASVNLMTPAVVGDVLRRLKVTPGALRKAVRAAAKQDNLKLPQGMANTELLAVFTRVADEIAETLPPVPWSRPGRAGAVRFEGASIELL